MISISDLTYYVGGRALYDDASLFIKEGTKIGLVGLNGTGKSTFLKILNGDLRPERGKINKGNEVTIGFLNQDMLSYTTHDTIRAVAMQAFKHTTSLQKKIDEVLHKMETDYTDDLVDKLTEYQEKFEQLGGYEAESKTEKVLEGIGFKTRDLDRPMSEFSGGWRMRVLLAKLLLEQPSLLMLDEPTNHLDIVSIQWLEGYLRSYPGAVIVISHDRKFLDNTTNTTVEVANKQLNLFSGNYSFYLQDKELKEELQHNAFVNQQKKIKDTQKFIERFRSKASKAKQVQSRVKSLDKLDRVEDIAKAPSTMKLKFNLTKPSGREVITLDNISKNYGNNHLFKDTSIKIERNDKIALIGENGKGKTTLLNIIAQIEEIQGGQVLVGHNVEQVFYAQHQVEALNLDNTIYEEMVQTHPDRSEAEVRSTLGALLFIKDDVKKKIKVLSGGEKARVALAKIILSGGNFLIFDEPTNHLDMISIDILIHALKNYEGTFIVVSHNRYFIEQLANKIWYIEDKKVKEFADNYEAYDYWMKTKDKI